MAVPYTFGSATTSIPLSQLDSNFATTITLGNTAIQLGNTVTTLNNMTFANATVSSGNATVTNANVTTLTATNDATINGQTVGKGYGSGTNNTALGVSVLGSSSLTGNYNTGIGYGALTSVTTGGNNTGVGNSSGGKITTGADNIAIGVASLGYNAASTTGSYNVAVGDFALTVASSGANNTAVGHQALNANTTASDNTAVGYQAAYSNQTGTGITALGKGAAYAVTGNYNTVLGWRSGEAITSGQANTIVGALAGNLSTGSKNTFIGGPVPGVSNGCASAMTTGSSNTIIGNYNGNQGGLDIRTASNYIVLSDGDGNPRLYNDGTNWTSTGNSFSLAPATTTNAASLICNNTGGSWFFSIDNSSGTTFGQGAYARNIYSGSASYRIYVTANSGGVYLAPAGTSWTSNSDERLKENLVPIENGLAKVASLRAVTGNYIADDTKKSRAFLIAQDLQAVLPEAVDATEPEKLGVQYTDVIPLLVASIKELKALVDAQATEIAELKAKVSA